MQPGPVPDRINEDRVERPELLFAAVFIPIAAFSWVGILLAELGAFNGWRILAGGLTLSAIGTAAAVREFRRTRLVIASVTWRSWITLSITLATAIALFSKPGEYAIEGADASVYLAIGHNIATTGGIPAEDPIVGMVPQDLQGSFFITTVRHPDLKNRLPGGLRIGDDGKVHPDFFHLLPMWIAIAITAGGAYGGYFVNVAFAVLGVFVVWLIGRRVWSRAAGGVAAALLTLNFGQIYYARQASSEMLAQFLLLSAAYFTILAWDTRHRVAGACAGVAVGLAAFTRPDLLGLLLPFATLWLFFTRHGVLGRAWPWYLATLALVSTHAVIHALTSAELYFTRLIGDGWRVADHLLAQLNLSTLLIALAVTALLALGIKTLRRKWLVWVGLAGAVVIILLSPASAANIARLVSPVGLLVAFAGLVIILTRPLDWRVLPILVPVLAETLLMLAWRENAAVPPDFRRAVPAVLPGAVLFIGLVVGAINNSRGWPSAAIWLLPVGLGGWFVSLAAPILRMPPAMGIHAQLSDLASQIPPDAVVITDRSVPGHLALALHYTFHRPALRMDLRPPGADGIGSLVDRILSAGRPVFVAVAPMISERPTGLRRSDVADFDMRASHEATLSYDIVVPVYSRFPSIIRSDRVPVSLYQVSPRDTETQALRPLTVDIGGDDFPFLIRGFHGPEASQSSRARWTTDLAQLAIPRLAAEGAARPAIVLRLSAYRPNGIVPATVRVMLDDIPIGVIPNTTSALNDYRLSLPAPARARLLAGPTTLTISADAFVPKAAGLNDDERTLGIVLDFVRIE